MKKVLIFTRTLIFSAIAVFLFQNCRQDKNLAALVVRPTEQNTKVLLDDSSHVVAATKLELVGRYAYYTATLTEVYIPGQVSSTGIVSPGYSAYQYKGTFKGYLNLYKATVPVEGVAEGMPISFATTLNLLDTTQNNIPDLKKVTNAVFEANLLATNKFLVGKDVSDKLDSIYVLNFPSLVDPPANAQVPPISDALSPTRMMSENPNH